MIVFLAVGAIVGAVTALMRRKSAQIERADFVEKAQTVSASYGAASAAFMHYRKRVLYTNPAVRVVHPRSAARQLIAWLATR